jgi:two-component system OmpR family response regulator
MTVVLVAEDDPAQLQGLTAFLRHAGFQVHPARSGYEALAVAERVRPDAAICDWNLGGSPDGADLVLELQSAYPDLVPIFITGADVGKLKGRTRKVREPTYFSKPVAPERLLEALAAAGCEPQQAAC